MGSLISSVGNLFGGATNNSGFTAQSAPIIQPVTLGQVNQGQTFAQNGLNQSNQLASALVPQANQGIQSQSALTNALQNEANGQGPNPAAAALNQQTGQNIANQAALGAGQRGASNNVGLIERQVGQQGAATQQNAISQGAILQAQQQLAAQNQLQNLAANQIGQQAGAINGLNQAGLTNQSQLLGALQGYNTNQVQNTASQNSTNQAMAGQNAQITASALGGAFSGGAGAGQALLGGGSTGGAGALGALAAAKGGEVETDHIGSNTKILLQKALTQKAMPPHLKSMADIFHPKLLQKMACGGMAEGAVVPGDPKVPGKNTTKNDIVPALLTPKEIVLPLSVTQSKNPGEAAKAFVEKEQGKKSDSDFKKAIKDHVKNRKSKR